MQNVFNLPRRLLLALAVVLVALTVFSTHQLMYARTTGAFGAVVLSSAGLLALLVVVGLGHVVAMLKPLLEPRVGSADASRPWPWTHRQQLEHSVASTVANYALERGCGDGAPAGNIVREALDALTGAGEQKAVAPGLSAGISMPGAAYSQCPRDTEGAQKLATALKAAVPKTAVRVTPADIEANIAAEYSFTLDKALAGCPLVGGLDRVTLAVVVLRNGTKLVGVNYGAIDPARHDAEQGRVEARAAAVEQVWPLMGYELRTKLAA